MGDRRPVEMVRLEQPEEIYEVEAVFGRDASSVFPNMNKDDDPMEALKASIGAKRFVSESELEEIKQARGLNVDDGTAAPDKPLAEILAERKKAKQDAFEDQWKQMKTGKNRPLEPDELEFLETLAQREAQDQVRIRSQEQVELEAFRAAVAAAAAAGGQDDDGAGGLEHAGLGGAADGAAVGPGPSSTSSGGPQATAAGRKPVSSKASSKSLLPTLVPVVKVKPKGSGSANGAAAAGASQPETKRQRLDSSIISQPQAQQQQEQQETLPEEVVGLLGGYASDSE